MTENNVAAQAGDEPMPGVEYEIELLPCVYPGTVPQLKTAYEAGHRHALRAAGEYVRQKLAAQVSPRATADVERDAARYRWLRDKANNTHDRAPMVFNVDPEELIRWTDALYGERLDGAVDMRTAATKGAKP